MKRAATHLFKRQSKNRVLFSKLSKFYFDLRPPGANPRADLRARQRSENPTPGATRMCESPGVARGDGHGLELTDTLFLSSPNAYIKDGSKRQLIRIIIAFNYSGARGGTWM